MTAWAPVWSYGVFCMMIDSMEYPAGYHVDGYNALVRFVLGC